ncbi:MAG: signal peptidase I [Chloracidobacterium sp.]|nr:signal peptidase I [Chloracidobacterium sp.]
MIVVFFGFLLVSCVRPVIFEGVSMTPTIKDGDRLRFSSNISKLERGDIILFKYPKDPSKFYIKRVVGLPSERIGIRDGRVFINDTPFDESYVDTRFNQNDQTFPPITVEPESYFVMGDNRDNSSDSRYWGTVDRNLIQSKYVSGD